MSLRFWLFKKLCPHLWKFHDDPRRSGKWVGGKFEFGTKWYVRVTCLACGKLFREIEVEAPKVEEMTQEEIEAMEE